MGALGFTFVMLLAFECLAGHISLAATNFNIGYTQGWFFFRAVNLQGAARAQAARGERLKTPKIRHSLISEISQNGYEQYA